MTRPRHPMPDFIHHALVQRGLVDAYHARPPYQQNDYVGWITRAKLPDTQRKRLEQMLDELAGGTLYMNMAYRARNVVAG
jgi:uncharacterized protein YdeI (YjbR/CyaY-like superfamily)